MSKSVNHTKASIVKAAISLFAVQGFGSTSIREIADTASVNSALVSYHFKNKQGILEWMMIDYFEKLFAKLQPVGQGEKEKKGSCFQQLIASLDTLIGYQAENMEVSAIILRELSVDSMLVREVMSTYMARLKAHFANLLETGIERGEFDRDLDVEMQLIHMMGGMFFPYSNPQIMRELFYVEPMSPEYRQRYISFLSKVWGYKLKNEEI